MWIYLSEMWVFCSNILNLFLNLSKQTIKMSHMKWILSLGNIIASGLLSVVKSKFKRKFAKQLHVLQDSTEVEESLTQEQIETVLAKSVGTKVFRIYRPRGSTSRIGQYVLDFQPSHIDTLVSNIEQWIEGSRQDMEECEIMTEE